MDYFEEYLRKIIRLARKTDQPEREIIDDNIGFLERLSVPAETLVRQGAPQPVQNAEVDLIIMFLEKLKHIYQSNDWTQMQGRTEIVSEDIEDILLNKYNKKWDDSILSA